jgi:hypothetical protein
MQNHILIFPLELCTEEHEVIIYFKIGSADYSTKSNHYSLRGGEPGTAVSLVENSVNMLYEPISDDPSVVRNATFPHNCTDTMSSSIVNGSHYVPVHI